MVKQKTNEHIFRVKDLSASLNKYGRNCIMSDCPPNYKYAQTLNI